MKLAPKHYLASFIAVAVALVLLSQQLRFWHAKVHFGANLGTALAGSLYLLLAWLGIEAVRDIHDAFRGVVRHRRWMRGDCRHCGAFALGPPRCPRCDRRMYSAARVAKIQHWQRTRIAKKRRVDSEFARDERYPMYQRYLQNAWLGGGLTTLGVFCASMISIRGRSSATGAVGEGLVIVGCITLIVGISFVAAGLLRSHQVRREFRSKQWHTSS